MKERTLGVPALRAVLFDWDGTLLDSYQADAQAYLAMFQELGIGWGLREFARHYAPDWYKVYRAAGIPRPQWDTADRIWRKHYRAHCPRLLPGARSVLAAVGKRYELGLVTSGDRARVSKQLREFCITQSFAARVFAEDTVKRKPHPAPIACALERMRLEPKACVYVGDSAEDMEMARRAGVPAIAVLGPFPTEKRLRASRPEMLLQTIAELPKALKFFRL